MKTNQIVYELRLRDVHRGQLPSDVRLARALKVLLRSFDLRNIGLREIPPDAPPTVPTEDRHPSEKSEAGA
jgi:hypothetical protein